MTNSWGKGPVGDEDVIGYIHASDHSDLRAQQLLLEARLPRSNLRDVYVDVNPPRRFSRAAVRSAVCAVRAAGVVLAIPKLGHLIQDVAFLQELHGVRFLALDDPLANEASLPVLLRQAEIRESKSRRIRSSLATVKRELELLSPAEKDQRLNQGKPIKLGGSIISDSGRARSADVRRSMAEARRAAVITEILAFVGPGRANNAQIASHLNQKGLLRPRGGEWSSVEVSRITATLFQKNRLA